MKNYENNYEDLFLKKFNEILLSTAFLGSLIWVCWMHFYFKISIFQSIMLLISGSNVVIKPFFLMCISSAFFACVFLIDFCYRNSSRKDEHHRGSKLNN